MLNNIDDPLANNKRYEKLRDLNSGTFGFVVLCRDRLTNDLVAIKFIERGDKITKYVEREIQNHRELIHPHIIQFREVFLTPKYLAIVMEFAEGGDMFEYVVKKGGLAEDDARWFFQQLLVALDYCHRKKIISRDVKLENTLLDSNPRPLVKICDFGYSKNMVDHSRPQSKVGTPGYMAPEVISKADYNGQIADVWSCGVMLYVMLVGAYPFERPEDKHDPQKLQKMIQRILKVQYEVPPQVQLSHACKDLLERILVADPKQRITIKQIQKHPWYLKDLPPGVLEMNDQIIAGSANYLQGLQSVQEIERILVESRKPLSKVAAQQKVTNEGVNDGLISQELNQNYQ